MGRKGADGPRVRLRVVVFSKTKPGVANHEVQAEHAVLGHGAERWWEDVSVRSNAHLVVQGWGAHSGSIGMGS